MLAVVVSFLISSSEGGAGSGGPGALPLLAAVDFGPGGGGGGGRPDFPPGVGLRLLFPALCACVRESWISLKRSLQISLEISFERDRPNH